MTRPRTWMFPPRDFFGGAAVEGSTATTGAVAASSAQGVAIIIAAATAAAAGAGADAGAGSEEVALLRLPTGCSAREVTCG